jgi:hypothetical protein
MYRKNLAKQAIIPLKVIFLKHQSAHRINFASRVTVCLFRKNYQAFGKKYYINLGE